MASVRQVRIIESGTVVEAPVTQVALHGSEDMARWPARVSAAPTPRMDVCRIRFQDTVGGIETHFLIPCRLDDVPPGQRIYLAAGHRFLDGTELFVQVEAL